MNKQDFASVTSDLKRGDRVCVRLRPGCYKPSDDFDGQYTGKVLETGPGLIGIAIARQGLRWFTFYPLESVTLLARRGDA